MKISGIIFDKSDNSTLPGANINLVEPSGKVTSFGVNSDDAGKFEISSDSILPNTTFRISYIGYKDQIYSAAELQNKHIYLSTNAILLDNLIITKDNSKVPGSTSDTFDEKLLESIKKNKKPIILISAIAIIGISIFIMKKNL